MSFLRPKVKDVPAPAAPQTVASPVEVLQTIARRRRLGGGRNSFGKSAASAASQSGQARPATVTGVNG